MLQEIAATPISDISLRDPVRVRPDTQLFSVVAQLREVRAGAALVEDDDGRLLGIFTERDLMTRIDHHNFDWHKQPVSEVMTRDPRTADADESLAGALSLMGAGSFRHLPIIAGDNRASGLVSIRDILAHIVEHYPEEFLNLPPDPEREMSGRWGG